MVDDSVSVRDLTVCFDDFVAVESVSFAVKKGEVFGFLGANGAGKTTTIRVLCGLLTPTKGQASICGYDVAKEPLAVKSRVGYMSQKFTLYEDMTVEENLQFASQLRKLEYKTFLARRKKLLDFISFDRKLSSLVCDLPGGIKQQVSLAASLLHDPEVVFLDEPTAGVTPAYRARFWALIKELAQEGHTVFVTTHYMDEAEQCGRIALMRSGQLIALDSPTNLKHAHFPHGLIELEPKRDLAMQDLKAIKESGLFSLFEPYGMRFHVELPQKDAVATIERHFPNTFTIKNISPTLEDVFIRLVEGKTR